MGGRTEVGWFSDGQALEKQEEGLSRQNNGDLTIIPIIVPPPLSW